jgi:hypothetical protein
MNNLEHIQKEIVSILLLIVILSFTSSHLTPELSEDQSLAERLPLTEGIN